MVVVVVTVVTVFPDESKVTDRVGDSTREEAEDIDREGDPDLNVVT